MIDFAIGECPVEFVMQFDGVGDDGATVEFGSWSLFRVAVDEEFVVELARNC